VNLLSIPWHHGKPKLGNEQKERKAKSSPTEGQLNLMKEEKNWELLKPRL